MKTDPNHSANVINEETTIGQMGLTKREYFAAIAMQSFINHEHYGNSDDEITASLSVGMADALINELNKTKS